MALSARKKQALVAITTCGTLQSAAQVIGVHADTLRRWRHEEEFRQALDTLQDEAVQQFHLRLSTIAGEALNTLATLHQDTRQSGATRARAASDLIQFVLRAREQGKLASEYEELRRLYEELMYNGPTQEP